MTRFGYVEMMRPSRSYYDCSLRYVEMWLRLYVINHSYPSTAGRNSYNLFRRNPVEWHVIANQMEWTNRPLFTEYISEAQDSVPFQLYIRLVKPMRGYLKTICSTLHDPWLTTMRLMPGVCNLSKCFFL